jgi:hypothetical protein
MQTRLWWRLWWGLAESAFGGSLESGGRFCVDAFGRNLASVAVKMFSHLIKFLRNLTNFVLSIRVAINCITVQHKIGFFPSTLTDHTALVCK